MNSLRGVLESFLKWIDAVAAAIVNAIGRLSARRTVQVIEQDDGAFAIRTGRKTSGDRLIMVSGPPPGPGRSSRSTR